MSQLGKRFGEDVGEVVRTRNLAKDKKTLGNLLTDEEVAELDVLGATMEGCRLGEMDGAAVVTP